MKAWFRNSLRLKAVRATRLIAHRYGERIGFVYVGGYPKSGTTWLSQMVSHYLDIPYVDPYFFPLTFPGVVHNHWNYHVSLDHSIYLIRDGRDVMVSLFMNLMKAYSANQASSASVNQSSFKRKVSTSLSNQRGIFRRLHKVLGKNFDPWDLRSNLPQFMDAELKKPFLSSVEVPWHKHIEMWRSQSKNSVFIKFEDLIEDGTNTLTHALNVFLNSDIDEEEINHTIRRYSFSKKTGRTPGEEDRKSFARKGIRGDWINHFSKEARQVFDNIAGQTLIDLGYEKNRDWVDVSGVD